MTTATTSTFSNALKILYPEGLEELWLGKQAPFLSIIPKTYDFEGASKQIDPLYAGIRAANSFTVAQAGKSTTSIAQFTVTRVKAYSLFSVDCELLKATQSKRGALAKALDNQLKGAGQAFARLLSNQAWGAGYGVLAQVAASGAFSTTTCTLAQYSDAIHFQKGMVVCCAASATPASVRAGTATLAGVDRSSAGTLTATANWTTSIPAAANGDYLVAEGSWGSGTVLAGVLGWIPTSVTSASWFGVDRTVDSVLLGGHRVNGSGAPLEETVFDAQAEIECDGGESDTLLIHPRRFAELKKNMHSKAWVPIEVKSTNPKVGFSGLGFAGPKGDIEVLSDPCCPYAYALLTERDSWELAGLGEIPHMSEEDGSKFMREVSDDAIEGRMKFYGNLLNWRPKNSCLITI